MTIKNPPPKLCRGENWLFAVTVEEYRVYQDVATRWNVPISFPYRTLASLNNIAGVRSSSADSSVIRQQSVYEHLASTYLWSMHRFVAGEPGTTSITFTYRDLAGRSPAPQTVTVQVTECDYEVEVVSLWHVNANRNVVARALIQTTLVSGGQNINGQTDYLALATVENLAWTPSIGGCRGGEVVSESEAQLYGVLHDPAGERPYLEIRVQYRSAMVDTSAGCPTNTGEADDPAKPQPVTFTDLSPGGANECVPTHVLEAPGLGSFTGPSCILLVKVHR